MKQPLKEQVIPIALTIITFIGLCALLYVFIQILNIFPTHDKIQIILRKRDILVGLTIYLKTAIDFAIFIGNLMHTNPGYKKRIAIEFGTAIGNALGTLATLIVWNFFREIPILMAVMITIASLVLLRMAQESVEEFLKTHKSATPINSFLSFLKRLLSYVNNLFKPVLGKLIPEMNITNIKVLSFWNLAFFSLTIPFILGLDDFAGYIPLFSVINVFGFAVGVFLGHMILNIGLFLSPKKTTSIVRSPVVLILGGLAFIGIALWGFYEVFHILSTLIY